MTTTMLILGGLVLLAAGGELIVRGAVGLSQLLRISPLLAGLTIVGFGTSTPELATSIQAAMGGSPGIALGNVIGSNVANILLILGISALIMPLAVNPASFKRDSIALGGSALLCAGAILTGRIEWLMGAVLVLALTGYVWWAYRSEARADDDEAHRHIEETAETTPKTHNGWILGLMVVAGLAGAIFGARLLVDGAVTLASAAGVSESVIGLTVVAVGTSLPELIACLIAVWKRHPDVALGNIVGSNIYNVLGILGLTAIVHPIEAPAEIIRFDVPIVLAVTALLLVQLRSGWKISRMEGALLITLYAGYTVFLILR
ncbi:calcium/sodium antiporter [Altererythrobacter sp. H2]|uniref:calcium/sodium antiporter n=1 Tax=Altererythrobacter sp. H2 TaxID=3108391 RepID=UPI002B4BE032|nr:calcium/sodium antiporter [Altererythrobacter sp. H2]WRK95365.1 calcium/sodium antiporter [Altererythrobacter sp. H2]